MSLQTGFWEGGWAWLMQCSRKLGHWVSRDRAGSWLLEADILGNVGKAPVVYS